MNINIRWAQTDADYVAAFEPRIDGIKQLQEVNIL